MLQPVFSVCGWSWRVWRKESLWESQSTYSTSRMRNQQVSPPIPFVLFVISFLQTPLPPPQRTPDAVVIDSTTRDQVSVPCVGSVAELISPIDKMWVGTGLACSEITVKFESSVQQGYCLPKKNADWMMQQKIKKTLKPWSNLTATVSLQRHSYFRLSLLLPS